MRSIVKRLIHSSTAPTVYKNSSSRIRIPARLLHSTARTTFDEDKMSTGMLKDPSKKYRPIKPIPLENRQWPSQQITKAPRWLSSDLRDGNQSNVNPMTIEQKTRFYNMLVQCGFKEIEVAFPAASDTDFNFVRGLVEQKLGEEEGVWLQVLTQSREDLIRRTMASVRDAPRVIFHMYNATSPLFRKVVFNNSKQQTIDLAVKHTNLVRDLINEAIARGDRTDWQFEYSPETFTQTEPEFAVEICNAVQEAWFKGKDRSKEHPIIFNLPATVEVAGPNVYADQIEYFSKHINNRDHIVISLHTHNDRGTGLAATELGLLAGGQRVEGCCFGNGERTGNVDLVNVALNMYTHGVDPQLDFSDIFPIIETVTSCNEIPVHPRHPYAGDLVFTAFSGSHQDAVKKGFAARHKEAEKSSEEEQLWQMPYLGIDPADIGCTYEAVIRVNSQSGKGGVAYLVQQALKLDLPRRLQVAFYTVVQEVADRSGKEMTADDIETAFRTTYFLGKGHEGRYTLVDYALDTSSSTSESGEQQRHFRGKILDNGKPREISGTGNGPLSSLINALSKDCGIKIQIKDYHEHAIGKGSDVQAASYVEVVQEGAPEKSNGFWGVGIDTDVTAASLKAVLSAASASTRSTEELEDQVDSKIVGRSKSEVGDLGGI